MRRIEHHPVIEMGTDKRRSISFSFEGEPLRGYEGEPIAAALGAAGIHVLRYSRRFDQARGLFCGIGQCQECTVVVDGVPNVRSCVEPLREGMSIERQHGRGKVKR